MSAKDPSRCGAGALPLAHTHAPREPEGASANPQMVLDGLPIGTPDYLRVLGAILKLHNPKHKGVSHKTMLDRQRFLTRFFTELRKEAGFADADPRRLTTRQVEPMVERWLRRDLSTATIHNYVCFLRTYCSWIGRPGMVRKVEDYVGAESPHARRKQVATFDHSWSARRVDFEATLAQVARMDRWVGRQLELCQRFGMRPKEARHFRPHKAVLPRERVDPADAATFPEHETFVRIEHGTKGGRPRDVPQASDVQRELLGRLTAAVASGCFVGQPGLTADQSRRRFYYVLECCGVTHAKLGVVAHGLRHEHANDVFEADAGGPSPVRGGVAVPPRDPEARERVARRLGHNRPRVARCYLGLPPRAGPRNSDDAVCSPTAWREAAIARSGAKLDPVHNAEASLPAASQDATAPRGRGEPCAPGGAAARHTAAAGSSCTAASKDPAINSEQVASRRVRAPAGRARDYRGDAGGTSPRHSRRAPAVGAAAARFDLRRRPGSGALADGSRRAATKDLSVIR